MFKISEHLDKISWTAADKVIFLLYGFVNLVQIKFLGPSESGKFTMLLMVNTFILAIGDSFGLQTIIQYTAYKEERPKVLTLSLLNFVSFVFLSSLIVWLFKYQVATLMKAQYFVNIADYLVLLSMSLIFRAFAQKIMFREYNFKGLFFSDLIFFGFLTVITLYLIIFQRYLNWVLLTQSYIFSAFSSSIFSLFVVRKYLKFSFNGTIKNLELVKFSGPLAISSLLYNIPRTMEVYIIKYFFSIEIVGIYSSAKTLYRVFDEIGNAVYGLIYPVAAKLIKLNDKLNLKKLMEKSTSFLFVFILALVIPLELGLTDLIVKIFLGGKFLKAIPFFRLMLVGSLAYPLIAQSLVLIAANDLFYSIKSLIVANLILVCSLITIGYTNQTYLIPLGVVFFNLSSGLFYYLRIKNRFNFEFKSIFSSIPDSYNFAKSVINK